MESRLGRGRVEAASCRSSIRIRIFPTAVDVRQVCLVAWPRQSGTGRAHAFEGEKPAGLGPKGTFWSLSIFQGSCGGVGGCSGAAVIVSICLGTAQSVAGAEVRRPRLPHLQWGVWRIVGLGALACDRGVERVRSGQPAHGDSRRGVAIAELLGRDDVEERQGRAPVARDWDEIEFGALSLLLPCWVLVVEETGTTRRHNFLANANCSAPSKEATKSGFVRSPDRLSTANIATLSLHQYAPREHVSTKTLALELSLCRRASIFNRRVSASCRTAAYSDWYMCSTARSLHHLNQGRRPTGCCSTNTSMYEEAVAVIA